MHSEDAIQRYIVKALNERGPAPASELAKVVVESLAEDHVSASYPDVKSSIWRLVDERRLSWTTDRKIAIRPAPADYRVTIR